MYASHSRLACTPDRLLFGAGEEYDFTDGQIHRNHRISILPINENELILLYNPLRFREESLSFVRRHEAVNEKNIFISF